jgi:hypothetical protein
MRIELSYRAQLLAAEGVVAIAAAPTADGSSSATWAAASRKTNAIAPSLETITPDTCGTHDDTEKGMM